ncbi:hypothetical protein FQR65_LT15943 [Abscondita terminalis]|nr:hypothetical protein FQR65_LT15943 [Abscondita terminalis]
MSSINERKEVSECLDSLLNRLRITRESLKTVSEFGKGVNYTGEIIRLWVHGRNEKNQEVELSFLLKIAFRDVSRREMFSIERAYQCEAFMYGKIFSSFAQMQEQRKSKIVSNRTRTSILAKEIGKLHAMSFSLRIKNPQLFREFSKNIRNEKLEEELQPNLVLQGLHATTPKFLSLFDSEECRMLYEKVRILSNKFHEMYRRFYRFDPEDEYGVIGHCDLWASNLLFKEQEVRIIDWQTSRVCSAAVDLSMMLFICCDGGVRHNHRHDLIEAYYDNFSKMLRQFGEDPNVVFPRAVLEKQLKTYSGYSLCLALKTVTMMSISEDEIPDPSLFKTIQNLLSCTQKLK